MDNSTFEAWSKKTFNIIVQEKLFLPFFVLKISDETWL